ncbi:hypothetical protein ACM0P9_05745 [Streptococcus pluranimalium]
MKNSNISTLDASNWTYQFEKKAIEGFDTDDIVDDVQKYSGAKLPTHLEYLDSTYDNKTGTSGTAFLDKNTGEVIIAYTGTNKDGNAVQDIIGADLSGIGMGIGGHYQPAFDFYEKIRGQYGDNITLTGHSLGGNVAQRVALEYNVDNTVVYNSAPLYVNQTYGIKERLYDWVTPGESNVERIDQQREIFTGQVTRLQDEQGLLKNGFGNSEYYGSYYVKIILIDSIMILL